SIGFKKDPGPDNEAEDPEQTRMSGTIPSANAGRILRDPHVKTILLAPAGFALPADKNASIKVQLELMRGMPLVRQRLLAEQTVKVLQGAGFDEAVGYDNRGHSRIVGRLPAGKVESLIGDLRGEADLPAPLKNGWPIEVV